MPTQSSKRKNPIASLRDSAKANRSARRAAAVLLIACPPAQKLARPALTASSLKRSASACRAVQKAGLGLEQESLTLLSRQARGTLHHPAGLEAATEVDAPLPRALEQEPE